MIEFVLKNRKLRLHPDGIMYYRDHKRGVETKTGRLWKQLKFNKDKRTGYIRCTIAIDAVDRLFQQHRLVYYAHNQDWDIWDSSHDNQIDHINHKRDDNCIENLHVVNHQQNNFNRSNVKGYTKRGNKFEASIMIDGKSIYIGLFENEEDAHNAYIKRKLELHII